MTLLVDQLGRLFTHLQHQGLGGMGLKMFSWGCQQKNVVMPFLVGCLIKVVLAAIKGANQKPRLSAYDLQKAIMEFFTENKLYSTRVSSDIPAVQAKKLVPLADCKSIWLGRSDGPSKEADSDDDPWFEIH